MSKFHTTVSRRDFMKGLGLAGVGLGAAAATAPVFHDLDDVGTSSKAHYKEPWYVKELEFERPSNEVDWSAMAVWDSGPDQNTASQQSATPLGTHTTRRDTSTGLTGGRVSAIPQNRAL